MSHDLVRDPSSRPAIAGAFEPGMRVVRLESFEASCGLPDDARSAYHARFTTLFLDEESARHGGLGCVTRVVNTMGETFALKTLFVPEQAQAEGDEAFQLRRERACTAFRKEYEAHRILDGFKGFPRLYGYAKLDGEPAIVMEWVEGVTLARARHQLAVDGRDRLAPLTAARLGRDLFSLLTRFDLIGEGFIHRDISPANIMLRTARLSLEEQVAEGSFDLCLIDFGSSVPLDPEADPVLTQGAATMRGATAVYAPPEMLSNDIPHVARLRRSAAIDVYAAASVLFELVVGKPPFDLEADAETTPFRVKTDNRPRMFETAHSAGSAMSSVLVCEPEVALAAGQASIDLSIDPESRELRQALLLVDSQLSDLILPCLSPKQEERPSAQAIHTGLNAFCIHYAQNAVRALRGERLIPCTADASWADSMSPYAVNRVICSVGRAISLAVLLVVVGTTSLLLDGVPFVWQLGQLHAQGEMSAWAVGALLLAPALLGGGFAWGRRGTRDGFVRGSVALASATAVLALLAACVSVEGLTGAAEPLSVLFAAASAGWCPLVLDYAMTVVPALIMEARRALRAKSESLPELDAPVEPTAVLEQGSTEQEPVADVVERGESKE